MGRAPHPQPVRRPRSLRDGLTENASLASLANRVDELRPPLGFSDEPALPDGGRSVEILTIHTNGLWQFGWAWNEGRGAWLRSDAGVDIRDEANDEPVAATTHVVQRVTQEIVYGDPDPGGNPRRLHHLVGSGEGTVYTDSRAFAVRWERPSADDATTWTFADTGDPLEMPPGQVWWEILPVEARLTES